jgi:hypothetical protein
MNFYDRPNSKKFVLFDTNVLISCSDFFLQNIQLVKEKVQVCVCDVLIAELLTDKKNLKILKDLDPIYLGPPHYVVNKDFSVILSKPNIQQQLEKKYFEDGSFSSSLKAGHMLRDDLDAQSFIPNLKKVKGDYLERTPDSQRIIKEALKEHFKIDIDDENLDKENLRTQLIELFFAVNLTSEEVYEGLEVRFAFDYNLFNKTDLINNFTKNPSIVAFTLSQACKSAANLVYQHEILASDTMDLDYSVFFPSIDMFLTHDSNFVGSINKINFKNYDNKNIEILKIDGKHSSAYLKRYLGI